MEGIPYIKVIRLVLTVLLVVTFVAQIKKAVWDDKDKLSGKATHPALSLVVLIVLMGVIWAPLEFWTGLGGTGRNVVQALVDAVNTNE